MEHSDVMKIVEAINENTVAVKEATAIERQKNDILEDIYGELQDLTWEVSDQLTKIRAGV